MSPAMVGFNSKFHAGDSERKYKASPLVARTCCSKTILFKTEMTASLLATMLKIFNSSLFLASFSFSPCFIELACRNSYCEGGHGLSIGSLGKGGSVADVQNVL